MAKQTDSTGEVERSMKFSESTGNPSCSIGWKEGSGGILAGVFAALCCTMPPFLGVLGLTGLAGLLGSMPFTYHLVLQWSALVILVFTWGWFGWKWSRMDTPRRRSVPTILVGLVLLFISFYVLKTWYAHVFLMG